MKQDIRVAYSEKSKYKSSVSKGLHILREQQKHYIYEAYKAMKKKTYMVDFFTANIFKKSI